MARITASLMQQRKDTVLAFLATGNKRTEEVRVHMVETTSVAYHVLRTLRDEGLIQSNHAKKRDGRLWRVTPAK